MTTAQAIERARLGFDAATLPRWATAVGLGLLCALSVWLRTRVLGAGFWIDEGISVGIAHHHLTAIPHLLRQDGSPPLYYLLLHVWIGWFGDGERATHAFSLVPAVACIPLVYWGARSLFGRTAGWVCALLAAVDPYLTYYGQETRMYALAACLSIVAATAYVHGVLFGRRRYLPLLVLSLVLLLYTHNWSLFLCVGFVVATVVFARDRWREAALAGAVTFLLYVPWLPTLASQAQHTGAPWAMRPGFHALLLAPAAAFSVDVAFGALAAAVGVGLARRRGEAAPFALLVVAATTILAAWTQSQFASTWASRYFAVLLGPLLLAVGAGLVRSGRLGIIALTLTVVLWIGYPVHDDKSNARAVSRAAARYLAPGDLVLTTHPEQTPVLRYYLGPRFRYATQLGPVPDPRVMDWRDALARLRAVTVARDLEPVLASVRPGRRFVVVSPVFRDYRAWQARWTREVYLTSQAWTRAIAADPRFRHVRTIKPNEIVAERNFWKPLQAVDSLSPMAETTLVLGAGPAGLTAAYVLGKAGRKAVVLEAESQVGGLAKTVEIDGFRFDLGGHRFFTKAHEVEALWDEIMGDELLRRPRMSRIYWNNKFLDYPLRGPDVIRKLGPVELTRCVASYARAAASPKKEEESLEDWVSNRFGRRLFELFFKTYTEKVWGVPTTEIRAEWAAQRIRGLSFTSAAKAAFLGNRGNKVKTLISEFRYPRYGPGQMWEAMAQRIEDEGGEILLDTSVERLDVEQRRVVAIEAAGRTHRPDAVISSLPLRDVVAMTRPRPPAEIVEAARGLRYRDFLTVALVVSGDDLFPDNWIYIHDPSVRVGRIQNYRSWSPWMVPDPEKACVGLEYFCFAGDDLWTMSDDGLVTFATRELERLGLARPGQVERGFAIRVPKAYPIYDADYAERVATIRAWLETIENLQQVGRNGLHRYNNSDHSMLTALRAVDNLLAGVGHDIWAVNAESAYHEEAVAEHPYRNAPETPELQASRG